MVKVLFFVSCIIIFHKGLLVYSVLQLENRFKSWYSIISGTLMIILAILAMIFRSWEILTLGFAALIFANMVDSSILAIRFHRPPSVFLTVYLLTFTGTLMAFFTRIWSVFTATYLLYWIMTYFAGRRALSRKYHSQKI